MFGLLQSLCIQHTAKMRSLQTLRLRSLQHTKPLSTKAELLLFQKLLKSFRMNKNTETLAESSGIKQQQTTGDERILFPALHTVDVSAIPFDTLLLRELLYYHVPRLTSLTLQCVHDPPLAGHKNFNPLTNLLSAVSFSKFLNLHHLCIRYKQFPIDLAMIKKLLRENQSIKLLLSDDCCSHGLQQVAKIESSHDEQTEETLFQWTESSYWRMNDAVTVREPSKFPIPKLQEVQQGCISKFFPHSKARLNSLRREFSHRFKYMNENEQ